MSPETESIPYKQIAPRQAEGEGYRAQIRRILKNVFGYDSFRGMQEPIIESLLDGQDTFVIMPTGAGKSLCYQLPALIMPGTAVIVSPLIALMKNQVDAMHALGVNARFLNSTLNRHELAQVKADLRSGACKLLYVAPESLTKEDNLALLRTVTLSFFAIDEAHCISEWGHDFRPEYRRIKSIVESLGNKPIIALTATATPKVQQDIQRNLSMEQARVFKTSFNRHNLFYEIRPKVDAQKAIIRFIRQREGESGIIYCLSRKKVESIAEFLTLNGVKALPYHAGLDAATRIRNQDAFLQEEVDVVVATIAFGMGIDKPDVRFVIHYDAPKSLEGYYQETGRAGRDSLEAHCLMFFAHQDIQKLDRFNKDKNVSERDNARHLLQEMVDFAQGGMCRRRQLLYYFGELLTQDCGHCDNCHQQTAPPPLVTAPYKYILEAARLTGERFPLRHLADLVAGVTNDYIHSYQHNQLSLFGAGKGQDVEHWYHVGRQALVHGLLVRSVEDPSIIRLTAAGVAYLANPEPLPLRTGHAFLDTEAEADDEGDQTPRVKAYDEVLFEQLRQVVKAEARQRSLPTYVIFQEASLREMATTYPTTEEALTQVQGVGLGKARKFGAPILQVIRKYVEENDIETEGDLVIKSSGAKSKAKIMVINQIDRKISLKDIARSRDQKMADLISEVEQICYAGTKLNLDYYINTLIDQERQSELIEYFRMTESDALEDAMSEFGGEYSEEEVRLLRLKFFADHAL